MDEYASLTDQAPERPIGLGPLLVAFAGAPLLWSAHLGVVYLLVAVDCTSGWNGAPAAIVAATLALGALSAWTGAFALRRWRSIVPERRRWDVATSDQPGWAGFALLVGVLMAGIFTLLILLSGASAVLVRTCV